MLPEQETNVFDCNVNLGYKTAVSSSGSGSALYLKLGFRVGYKIMLVSPSK